MFNSEEFEMLGNEIVSKKNNLDNNTSNIVNSLKEYCRTVNKKCLNTYKELLTFINKNHDKFFYIVNENGGDWDWVEGIKGQSERHVYNNEATIELTLIKPIIEITILKNTKIANAVHVKTFGTKRGLDVCPSSYKYEKFDWNRNDLDFWVKMKEKCAYLIDEADFTVECVKNYMKELVNIQNTRFKNMIKAVNDIEHNPKVTTYTITVIES